MCFLGRVEDSWQLAFRAPHEVNCSKRLIGEELGNSSAIPAMVGVVSR